MGVTMTVMSLLDELLFDSGDKASLPCRAW